MDYKSNVMSLSHNDLDGIGCQIVINEYYKNVTNINCSYNDTLEILQNIKKTLHSYDTLIVSDLILTEELSDYLDVVSSTFNNLTILWIDHHYQTEQSIRDNNINYIFDTTQSSTQLLAKHYNLESTFTKSVNAFDVWDVESEYFNDGMKYNSLFWNYRLKSFYLQFRKNQQFTNVHDKDYSRMLKQKDKYFDELESRGLVLREENIVMIFGDSFQNWTQLQYEGFHFNIQVFSFGKILIKINKKYPEELCKSIINNITNNIDNELLLNIGGHYHILSLTHIGNNDYNIIIDYAKRIYNTLKGLT